MPSFKHSSIRLSESKTRQIEKTTWLHLNKELIQEAKHIWIFMVSIQPLKLFNMTKDQVVQFKKNRHLEESTAK